MVFKVEAQSHPVQQQGTVSPQQEVNPRPEGLEPHIPESFRAYWLQTSAAASSGCVRKDQWFHVAHGIQGVSSFVNIGVV